jgi:hypothetical protein
MEKIRYAKRPLFDTFADLNAPEMIDKLNFKGLEALFEAVTPIKLAVKIKSLENSTILNFLDTF